MPSDIPLKVLPDEAPDAQTYTIALPTRFDDNGNVEAFEFPKSVPPEVAMAQIREANKRDAADTQIQKTLDPEYRKNIPFDDFKQWKNDERVIGDTSANTSLFDLIKDGAKAVAKGAALSFGNISQGIIDPDQKRAARGFLNVIEGGLQGTERLGGLMSIAWSLAKKGASKLFSEADRTDEIDYELYQKAMEMEETEKRRASGELMVDQAAKSMGVALPPASKQDIQDSNQISAFLDASIIATPFIGKTVGALVGQSGQAALSKLAPSALANIAGRATMAGTEYAGKALDYGTRKIIQGVDAAMGAVAQNSVTRGTQILGGRALAYGLDIYSTGGAVLKGALAGKGLRAAGEIGGTVLKAAAEDLPLRGALRELTETTGSDVVRFFARQSLKIAPPDAVFDALKHVAASATNTGFVSGTLNAMKAAAAQDDPVQGFMEGFATGAGGGALLGAIGAKGAAKEQQIKRIAEFFDNDIRSRQPEVAIDVNGQEVRINDINGRLELFNRSDLTPEQKQFILQLTQANELAGGTVIFHDGAPEVVQALEGVGMGAAEGVQFFRDQDGRSTILLNAREMNHGTAVEEVFHAMTTDAITQEVSRAINFNIKSSAATPEAAPITATPGTFAPRRAAAPKVNYLPEAMDFAERYIAALESSGMASGRAKAAEFRQRIARVATDPEMIPDIKADILKPIIDEYSANYARAALAGMKPQNLMEGGLRNLWDAAWDKTMGNLLSAFDVSKQGAAKDQITGHFFDERGRRIINPALERLVDRFLDSASQNLRKGTQKISEIMPANNASGVHYFDVRSSKPFMSYEDTIDGRETTPKEKKLILNESFKRNSAFLNSATGNDSVVVVTDQLKQDGAFPGNITKVKNGTQLIFSQGLPESFFDHLSQTGQLAEDQVKANKLLNRSMVAGQIVMLDAWANIGRSMKDRAEVYYARGNRAFLPISAQQAPTGGVTWNGLDVTRVWNYAKRAARKIKAVREELAARDIVSMQDFLPYLQQYFDNYSSTTPIPAAELKGFSPTMRDIISTALDISNRTTGEFADIDAANFKNPASFNVDLVGREGANIMTAYRKGAITYREQMAGLAGAGRAGRVARLGESEAIRTVLKTRESASLLQIRADRVLGLSDFSVGGSPVAIKYNPYRVTNLVRANFSPGRTTVEQLGDSQVYTDSVNGKRIIVKPNGKATLFDEGRKSIHETLDDAIERANINASKDDVLAMQIANKTARAPEIDQSYKAAFAAGDVSKMQNLIDSAAKAAGYNETGFHGLAFGELVGNKFDSRKLGEYTKAPSATEGFFFASKETAKTYAKQILDPQYTKKISDQAEAIIKPFFELVPEGVSSVLDSERGVQRPFDPGKFYEKDPRRFVSNTYSNVENILEDVEFRNQSSSKVLTAVARARDTLQSTLGQERNESAYSPSMVSAKLSMRNPFIYDQKGKSYRESSYFDIIQEAKSKGHDSVIIKNTYDGGPLDDIKVVFSPNQIKSADAVTRSSSGQLILPSERFQSTTEDIRFAPRRNTKARQETVKPQEQIEADLNSVMNAFKNTSLPARALADKVARLYRNNSITLAEMRQSLALLNNPDTSYTTARQASAEYTAAAVRNMRLYREGIISRGEMEIGMERAKEAEAAQQQPPAAAGAPMSQSYERALTQNMELYRQGAISRGEMERQLKKLQSAERRAKLSQMEREFVPESAREDVAAFMASQLPTRTSTDIGQADLRLRKEQARAFAKEQAAMEAGQVMEEMAKPVDQVEIKDPRIPKKAKIVRTSSGLYRVFVGAGLVGIKQDEEKAIKLAQKYAAP